MAPVEVVASYRTYNIKASALENLLHRVFAEVRLDFSQADRKGRNCLLYTSDAADERSSVDLGGRRIIKKKKL